MNEIRLIFRNSFYNILGQFLPLIVGFISIPLLIKNLGIERFGLLSLIWVFLGYLAFFDLGFSRAIIKIIAEELAKEKAENIPTTIWTATWVVGTLSILGSSILIFLAEPLSTKVFKIPVSLHLESVLAIQVIAISLPIVTLTAVYRGVLEAQQRFFVANILQSISGIMTYLIPFVVCLFDNSIVSIILGISIARLVLLIAHMQVCQREIPYLLIPRWIKRESLNQLFSFGSWLTVSNIISPLMVYFDRFILGSLIPVGNLAFYTTPYEIVTRVLILPSAVARVLFPTFSSALAVNRNEEAILHFESVRLLSLLLLPISSFLILFAEPGLHLWLGNKFSSESTLILQIFAVGIFFNGIANVPYTLIQSANRPDLTAKIHLFELPIYIGLLWYLTNKYGLLGAATAWSLRLIFDFFLLDSFAKKIVKNQIAITTHLLKLSFLLWLAFMVGQLIDKSVYVPVMFWFFLLSLIWIFFLSPREKRILLGNKLITLSEGIESPDSEKCLAIVVSYNPAANLLEFSEELCKQFDEVVIVDNNSNPESRQILQKLEERGCKLIYNTENLGIASALNQGFKYAIGKYNWVCTFDQDSNIDTDYRKKLFENLDSHFDRKNVAVIGPKIFEVQINNSIAYTWIKNSTLFEVPTVITSGSLIRVQAYQAVGGFNEALFIDYVDHEFSLKLRSKGFLVTQSTTARLFHKLGNSKAHRVLFREFYSTHHDALRRYYNTRNRFYVYFKFLLFEPIWVAQDFYLFLKETLKILLVEKDKMQKLKSISLGLTDCIHRKFGQRKSL